MAERIRNNVMKALNYTKRNKYPNVNLYYTTMSSRVKRTSSKFVNLILFALFLCFSASAASPYENVAVYEVKAQRLNLRAAPSRDADVVSVCTQGTRLEGKALSGSSWMIVFINGRTAYAHSDYLQFLHYSSDSKGGRESRKELRSRGGVRLGLGGWLLLIFIGLPFLRGVLGALWEILLDIVGEVGLFYVIFYVGFLPFRVLNWLQIFLHKPWRYFQRYSWPSENSKPYLRVVNVICMVPLYVVLTPLRFLNAVAFNLLIRPLSEYWSYLGEVLNPSDSHEGSGDVLKWIYMLPYRILKYPVYHGALTILECVVMTVVDTVYPAVTLYHGTSSRAADAIVICPDRNRDLKFYSGWDDGVWKVGGGNYAGDGIYFAPRSSTSRHYARSNTDPVLIICRVSLGRVLPLSLAPYSVYSKAGYPDAHSVTSYGLNNGYTSIEWWRGDTGWWEYCLLDWQNKYNESWRIRPISVMSLDSHFFKRIDGGSRHWLFDRMVLKDLSDSIFGG